MDRAERRRQLKEDRKFVERGLDVAALKGQQLVSLMRVLHDHALRSIEGRSVQPLMEFILSSFSQSTRRLDYVPIACCKGCSHCCHVWVAASVPEVVHVLKSIGKGRRQNAEKSVAAAVMQTDGKTFDERADMVTPCPMLDGNLCGVYDARPIVCRGAVSGDAGICERSYLHLSGEDIPTPLVYIATRSGYSIALAGALKHAGLVYHAYEFNAALKRALEQPNTEADWLAGNDVFAGLPQDPGSDPFTEPRNLELYQVAFG